MSCVSCNLSPAKYNYSYGQAKYCYDCAKFGMVVISPGECISIGCHNNAIYGWSLLTACEEHKNELQLLLDKSE